MDLTGKLYQPGFLIVPSFRLIDEMRIVPRLLPGVSLLALTHRLTVSVETFRTRAASAVLNVT
jgi:hypothetical protein